MIVPKVLETAVGEWLGVISPQRAYLDRVPGEASDAPIDGQARRRVGMLSMLAPDLRVASGWTGLMDWRLDGQITAAVRAHVFEPQRDAWLDLGECPALSGARLVLLGIGPWANGADLVQWQGLGRTCGQMVASLTEVDTWFLALPDVQGDAEAVAAFARGLVAGRRSGQVAAWDQRTGEERPQVPEGQASPPDVRSTGQPDRASTELSASQHVLRGLALTDTIGENTSAPAVNEALTTRDDAMASDHEAREPAMIEASDPPGPDHPPDSTAEAAEFAPDDIEMELVVNASPPPPPLRVLAEPQADLAAADRPAFGEGSPVEPLANVERPVACGAASSSAFEVQGGAMRTITWWIVTTHPDLENVQSRIGAALGQLPLR